MSRFAPSRFRAAGRFKPSRFIPTRFGGGVSDPFAGDASYLIAIRPAVSETVTITSSRVSAITNRGSGGATYDFTQTVAADRPTLGTMTDGTPALVFTSAIEWLNCDAFGGAMNDPAVAAWQVDLIVENDSIATAQCMAAWSTSGSNNGFQLIATDGTGDVRLQRKNVAGSTTFSFDSDTKIVAGQTSVISLVFQNGVVDGYLNGDVTYNNGDYVSTTGTIAANKFAIGGRNTPSLGLGWAGKIAFLGIKLWP